MVSGHRQILAIRKGACVRHARLDPPAVPRRWRRRTRSAEAVPPMRRLNVRARRAATRSDPSVGAPEHGRAFRLNSQAGSNVAWIGVVTDKRPLSQRCRPDHLFGLASLMRLRNIRYADRRCRQHEWQLRTTGGSFGSAAAPASLRRALPRRSALETGHFAGFAVVSVRGGSPITAVGEDKLIEPTGSRLPVGAWVNLPQAR